MSLFSRVVRRITKPIAKAISAVEKVPIIGKAVIAGVAPLVLPALPAIAAVSPKLAKETVQKWASTLPTQLGILGAGVGGSLIGGVDVFAGGSGARGNELGEPVYSPEVYAEASGPSGEYGADILSYGPSSAIPVYWNGASAYDAWGGIPWSGWGVPWSGGWGGNYWTPTHRAFQQDAYSSWYTGTYL